MLEACRRSKRVKEPDDHEVGAGKGAKSAVAPKAKTSAKGSGAKIEGETKGNVAEQDGEENILRTPHHCGTHTKTLMCIKAESQR